MGLSGAPENGNGVGGYGSGISKLLPSGKERYMRVDEDLARASDENETGRKSSTKKFVFACAIFASLNSILLGYGESLLFI